MTKVPYYMDISTSDKIKIVEMSIDILKNGHTLEYICPALSDVIETYFNVDLTTIDENKFLNIHFNGLCEVANTYFSKWESPKGADFYFDGDFEFCESPWFSHNRLDLRLELLNLYLKELRNII